ncbi:hypothetical protein EK21DRAFT_33165, partial [Setomelanomma holmii]
TRSSTFSCTKIQLRIHSMRDPRRFVRVHYVVQTLLHELAHIARGAGHGLSFWWRNAQLLKELEWDVENGQVKAKWEDVAKHVSLRGEVRGL